MIQDTNLNNIWLKIAGKSNIPETLEIGKSYSIANNVEITKEEKSNNQDGTFDLIYKAEILTTEILKDNGETIKAKDTRQNSVKIRKVIYAIWSQKNTSIPFDIFYDKFTNLIIHNADNLSDKIFNEKN